MSKRILCLGIMLALAAPLHADERKFDFSETPINHIPTNCISTVGGQGKPGDWRVIMDQMPLALAPLNTNLPTTAPKAVVAQLAWDSTDEHFPMLVLGGDSYGDFTFTTRFKIADGLTEQMAGVAFRMQDEKNYYYVRASVPDHTFYFYKVSKGFRSPPIGNNMDIPKGVWHDLTIQCTGPKIHILLDGKEALPTLTDPTFSTGKIALWTKSDSISYFTDAHVTFTPRVAFAQLMVQDVMKEYPHLLGVKVFAKPPKAGQVRVIASNKETEIGQPGEKADADVISRGVNYYRKDKDTETVYVTMPLRDRNGDPVASVRFVLKSFRGQTEDNALARVTPIIKGMQQRASAVDNLF